MHSYCDTCGKLQDYCPHEFASPEPTDQTREQIAEVLAEHRDRPCGHFAKGVKEWWSECEGCDWKDLATACDDCPIRFNEWRAGR
ncbi:MAG: hypothetical protein JWP74_1726 [Marmoricola sp.]|nr:hypothetical protein [Marmoricola sp.]